MTCRCTDRPAHRHPKSATYRTSDGVGLDTMGHVIKTMNDTLPDDPLASLLQGAGCRAGADRQGRPGSEDRCRILPQSRKRYSCSRPRPKPTTWRKPARISDEVAAILKLKSPAEKFAALRRQRRPAGAVPVGRTSRPFPLCRLFPRRHRRQCPRHRLRDALGLWLAVRVRSKPGKRQAGLRLRNGSTRTIVAGKAMSNAPLPDWVSDPKRTGVHDAEGSYSAATGRQVPTSSAPVYKRQLFPETVLGAKDRQGQDHLRVRRCAAVESRRRRHRDPVVQDQDAHGQRGRHRGDPQGRRRSRAQLQGPRDLAGQRAVQCRRESQEAVATLQGRQDR